MRWYALLGAAVLLCTATGPLQAEFTFNLNDTGGAGTGTDARRGFEEAANFWKSQFRDDITVNLDIGFTSLSPGVLGSASVTQGTVSYSSFKGSVLSDVTSAHDAAFAGGLPSGNSFSLYINRTANNPNGSGSTTPYVDNDGDANNTTVRLALANARALGLFDPHSTLTDAIIKFSSNFTFDFDRSDGITPGAFDFVGVAIHEIGHALGFISGVDRLDAGPVVNDNELTHVSPLDFTRFSQDSQAAGADIDWTADARPKYFSIDGGMTIDTSDAWSTGVNFGDGRQASHWKDNRNLGIMDPTLGQGELGMVTSLDLRAFDVIGFDLAAVPEPSSLLLLSGAFGAVAWRYRKRRTG